MGLLNTLQAAAGMGSPATNRRRRSQNTTKEDGTLMDFLQQSNKDRLNVGQLCFLFQSGFSVSDPKIKLIR